MISPRNQAKLGLIAVGLLSAVWAGTRPGQARQAQAKTPAAIPAPDPPPAVDNEEDVDPILREPLGKVTKVDRAMGEFVIQYGRGKGAEVGMTLLVVRPDPDRKELGDKLAWLEVTATAGGECTARVLGFRGGDREIQTGDVICNATVPRAFQLVRLADGDRPDAIRELKRARVEAARESLDLSRPLFECGMITGDRYLNAFRKLMEAERDAAATPAEQTAAIRAYLGRLNLFIVRELDRITHEFHHNSMTFTEALTLQAEAALMLAEARRRNP